jgi:hypothetical protein
MVFKERRKKSRQTADAKEEKAGSEIARQTQDDFTVVVQCNKLLGLWAAERLGITGDAVEAYAMEVVASDFEEVGDQDVVRKVMKDFADKGVDLTEEQLRHEKAALLEVARRSVEAQRS